MGVAHLAALLTLPLNGVARSSSANVLVNLHTMTNSDIEQNINLHIFSPYLSVLRKVKFNKDLFFYSNCYGQVGVWGISVVHCILR